MGPNPVAPINMTAYERILEELKNNLTRLLKGKPYVVSLYPGKRKYKWELGTYIEITKDYPLSIKLSDIFIDSKGNLSIRIYTHDYMGKSPTHDNPNTNFDQIIEKLISRISN